MLEQQHQQEIEELNALIDRGLPYKIGNKEFIIHRPYLGQLDLLAECLLNMEHDTQEFDSNPDLEAQKLIKQSVRWYARAVAIMILGDKCIKRNLLTGKIKENKKGIDKLTDVIMWNVKPKETIDFANKLIQVTGIVDFIFSTRYILKMTKRVTKPNLVEQDN